MKFKYGYFCYDEDSSYTADEVIETKQEYEFSGLYDEQGRPLYKMPQKIKLGYDMS